MRLSTRFRTRLNASYTDDYVVVQKNDSAIRRVKQIILWYTHPADSPLNSSLLSQFVKIIILVPLTFFLHIL